MTKAIKHIVEIHIQNIQGILVLDRKLHQQEDQRPRGLNKISAIASIRRNKNVTTSGTSYPLQPSSNMHSSNGSYLYHANWNQSDAKDFSSSIALQTNLHPLPKQHQKNKKNNMHLFDQQHQVNTTKFESKRFDVVIGLKRGNEFVVLATSLIHIDKEMANEEMTLPLIPIMAITSTSTNKSRTKGGDHHHDHPMTSFADDENRYFGLDAGAVLHCSVTVSSHSTWHYKKLEVERMMISSPKAPLFYDEGDTTVPKVNAKKEVLLQSRNPAINGDVTEEREYFNRDYCNEGYRDHYNTTYEDSGFDTYVGRAQTDNSNQHESEDDDDKKIESQDKADHEAAHMTYFQKGLGDIHVVHHKNDDISSIVLNKDQEKMKSMESEESADGQRNFVLTRESFSQPKQNEFPETHPHQKSRDNKLIKFAQRGFNRISKSLRVISDRGLTIFESSSDLDDDNIIDLYEENVFESIAVAAKRFSTIAMDDSNGR